jgi:hypothetical protein
MPAAGNGRFEIACSDRIVAARDPRRVVEPSVAHGIEFGGKL